MILVVWATPGWSALRLGLPGLVEVRGGLGVNIVRPNSIAMRMGVEAKSLIKHIEVQYLDTKGAEKVDARDTDLILNYREPLRHNKIVRIRLTWQRDAVQHTARFKLRTYDGNSFDVPDNPSPDDFVGEP
jgi:hypothetical protein